MKLIKLLFILSCVFLTTACSNSSAKIAGCDNKMSCEYSYNSKIIKNWAHNSPYFVKSNTLYCVDLEPLRLINNDVVIGDVRQAINYAHNSGECMFTLVWGLAQKIQSYYNNNITKVAIFFPSMPNKDKKAKIIIAYIRTQNLFDKKTIQKQLILKRKYK